MRSRLFPDVAKTLQTITGRWLRVLPYKGEGYAIYDLTLEMQVGRILVDDQNYWIYDGDILSLTEQEEIAGQIIGYQREMDNLIKSAGF